MITPDTADQEDVMAFVKGSPQYSLVMLRWNRMKRSSVSR